MRWFGPSPSPSDPLGTAAPLHILGRAEAPKTEPRTTKQRQKQERKQKQNKSRSRNGYQPQIVLVVTA